MDVWFDSGTSWAGALAIRLGRGAVADVYLEGSDQHRGWFQSSLLTAIAASGEAAAPFRTIVTHGFVVAADGRKMSKSLGNGVNPSEVIEGGQPPHASFPALVRADPKVQGPIAKRRQPTAPTCFGYGRRPPIRPVTSI